MAGGRRGGGREGMRCEDAGVFGSLGGGLLELECIYLLGDIMNT